MYRSDQSRFQQTPQTMSLNQDYLKQTHHWHGTQHLYGQHETAVLQPQYCHQVQHLQINSIKFIMQNDMYDTK